MCYSLTMGDNKKDLTSITEYSKTLQDQSESSSTPEDQGFLEEQKIEQIDNFESLEELSKTNPLPGSEAPADISQAETGLHADAPLGSDGLKTDQIAPPPIPDSLGGLENTAMAEAPPTADALSETMILPENLDQLAPPPIMDAALSDETKGITEKFGALDSIKTFAEKMPVGRPVVAAAYPFSLMISGQLTAHEREKLVDLINRENMGFREIDLEPQFACGKILIPRISEYAGVLIVQALRGSSAEIKFGPSDEIFATDATRESADDLLSASDSTSANAIDIQVSEVQHPAENLPLTPTSELPGDSKFVLIDAITASATLRSGIVEAQSSAEYQEVLEALQREIKYKAYRKGATAVINFSVTLTPLSVPTHYRLTAMGSAVKSSAQASRINLEV
jgi:uncharacterized protein YbjQ (UPF0145 family)